ncbi:MAG: tRNA preQ1(34) S-adenosylmethionine ribosyltransferase-isomerase QueA [Pseudomonadota bacterium]
MRVSDFEFHLPEARIALAPARPRDSARMLVVGAANGGVEDAGVLDLPRYLKKGDILVVNKTKVLPSQLTALRPARTEGGGDGTPVEVDATLHKRLAPDAWAAFIRPAKRVKNGDMLSFGEDLSANVTNRRGAEATLTFNHSGAALDAAVKAVGAPPLPPYIARKRGVTPQDAEDYQTVYAAEEGSVAAPTAGLHFTPRLFEALEARGVAIAEVILHVGAGTFLPVTAEDTNNHVMHAEWGEVTAETAAALNAARAAGGRIVAVGTTSLRLLESAADDNDVIAPFCAETDIFITPGYRFKAVDALMTNFHLPKSTLFMLVSAFAGLEEMRAAYAHAIDKAYRFYSYGDASLLFRK